MSEPKKDTGITERHIQTILASLITLTIVWMATSVADTNSMLARQDEKIIAIQTQLFDLKSTTANRYTSQDAQKDFRLVDTRLGMIERRLTSLENLK